MHEYRAKLGFSLILVGLCTACSGSSNSSPGTCPNIAGTWNLAETEDDTQCGGSVTTDQQTATVTQNGCSFTMTDGSEVLTGTITETVNGGHISGTLVSTDQGGTTTGSFTGSISADGNTGTATSSWTYIGLTSCSGTTQIVATRVGGGPTTDAGTSTATMNAICTQSAACSGTTMSATDLQECQQLTATMYYFIPDPDYTNNCINGLSCAQLSDTTSVQGCLDLDDASIVCNGSTLHGCSNTGKCSDVDCTSVCGLLGLTFDYCGFDSSKNHNVCFCQ